MSADLLRRAAAAMRERAEAAQSESPWDAAGMWWYPVMEIAEDGRAVERSHGFHLVVDAHGSGMAAHAASHSDAEHIASWHPAVALAVADLLDAEAALIDGVAEHPDLHMPINGARVDLLLAVARIYLGESS